LNTIPDIKKKRDGSNIFFGYILRFLVFTLIGSVVLYMNPFGIEDKTDEATQNALYKLIAPLYETNARKEIVIVLVNDNAIENLYSRHLKIGANEWPLLYSDHAYLLTQIAKHSPRAVFVDVYFKKERSTDDSFSRSILKIGKLKDKYGTQFIFARGSADEELTDTQKTIDKSFELAVNGWSGYGNNYPLKEAGADWSAALRLYELACLSESTMTGCSENLIKDSNVRPGDTLSVRWGSEPAEEPFPEFTQDTSLCLKQVAWQSILKDFFAELFKGIINIDAGVNKCGFHTVLYMDEIIELSQRGTKAQKKKLSVLLNDKVVLYGVNLKGLHDIVISPVHGILPGVMFHAMALDNLMTFGDKFTKGTDEAVGDISVITWAVTVIWLLFVQWWSSRSGFTQEQEKNYLAMLLILYLLSLGGLFCDDFELFLLFSISSCALGGSVLTFCGVDKINNALAKLLCVNGEPGKLFFVTFGVYPIMACAWFSFACLHYEPVNALGFVGLGFLVYMALGDDFLGDKIEMLYVLFQLRKYQVVFGSIILAFVAWFYSVLFV